MISKSDVAPKFWKELLPTRAMLQLTDQTDLAALELVARDVMPALAKM